MPGASENIEFAICLSAAPDEDLEVGKVYRVLPDPQAAEAGCLRVVDESGEDYLYAAERFAVLDLSEEVRSRLLQAVGSEPEATGRGM